jgi:hypothetical protein
MNTYVKYHTIFNVAHKFALNIELNGRQKTSFNDILGVGPQSAEQAGEDRQDVKYGLS